ncbi:MAG: hypothetical protein WD509_02360 [Candidatus Paceibacterota bacterium]
MVTISALLPRQFFFECPRCGTYHTSEKSLRGFITPLLEERLDVELKMKGVTGATLKFKDGCPLCEEDGSYEVELSVLRHHTH